MARFIEGPPQTTERMPHAAHPRVEGTNVAPRSQSGTRFKDFPVDEGLFLLIEPAAVDFTVPSPEILESLTGKAVLLRDATEKERTVSKEAQAAKKEREDIRDTILSHIEDNPDLRGLVSNPDDVKLTATPTHGEVVYDIAKLKKSARSKRRFMKSTSRRVVIEFVPRKDMPQEVLQAIVEEGLNSLGSRVARKANVTTTVVVHDDVVAQMVDTGEMTLLPDTRRVTEGFTLKATRLPVRRKNIKTRRIP